MRKLMPKIIGSDVELGNVVIELGAKLPGPSSAAQLLLAQIDGVSADPVAPALGRQLPLGLGWSGSGAMYGSYALGSPATPANPQDVGRKFLLNGGCAYEDMSHCEICTPELTSALDYVAAQRAMFLIARDAMRAANAALGDRARVVVMANNSDGHGHSWGGHFNVLIPHRLWRRICDHVGPEGMVAASHVASSVIYTGEGMVDSDGHPRAAYRLSQRAAFMERLVGTATTARRGLLNGRCEPLCGAQTVADSAFARLHMIAFDTCLSDHANFLKAGVTQLVLAMLEAGELARPSCWLEDPVTAVHRFSDDVGLRARAARADGRMVTATELQLGLLERARRFVERGDADEAVPDAGLIVDVWEQTLHLLRQRDYAALARRLDWAIKLARIRKTMKGRAELTWTSPQVRVMDFHFANLDETAGTFLRLEREGAIERLVGDEAIERRMVDPPEDTRAWTRAALLRVVHGTGRLVSVNWDEVVLGDRSGRRVAIELADPTRFTRAEWDAGRSDEAEADGAGPASRAPLPATPRKGLAVQPSKDTKETDDDRTNACRRDRHQDRTPAGAGRHTR